MTAKPRAVWYYDVISPYAYLQAMSLPKLGEVLDITARPILFAGLLKHWGHLGPAEIPAKRIFIYQHCLWLAGQRGLPFRMPPAHPFNPLSALRLLTAMEASPAQAGEALAFVFGEGEGVDGEDEVARLARRLGASPETRALASGDAVKAKLRQATEDAIAAGVFGVPTLVVDGRLFWGDDSEGMLRSYLDDPAGSREGEAARIDALPEGVSRRRA